MNSSCVGQDNEFIVNCVLLVKLLPFLISEYLYRGRLPYVIHVSNTDRLDSIWIDGGKLA